MTQVVTSVRPQKCGCCGSQTLAATKTIDGTTVLHVEDWRHGSIHHRKFSLADLVLLLDPFGTSFTAST
jgi:hypothetical protein